MFKLFVLVLALCAASSQAAFASLSFSGNVTIQAEASADFRARATSFAAANLLGIAKGFSYKSVKIAAGGGDASIDAVIGGGFVTSNIPPILYLGYATADISYDINNVLDFDASGQANFMATAYLQVIEKTAAGVVVKTQALTQNAADAALGTAWTFVEAKTSASAGAEIKWATFRSKPAGASWYLDLTVVTSNVIGVLNNEAANAVVSPKAIEVIIEIFDYPYNASGNTLSLSFISCSGSASATTSSVVSGSGVNRMFMYVEGGARVNGAPGSVTVEAWADFDVNEVASSARTMLAAKFGANYNCKKGGVKFPANAAHIVWDPSLGVGATAQESRSDAFAVIPSLAVIILSALAIFFY